MRFKSLIAMTGVLAAVAAFLAMPAQAQPKPADPAVAPVCANCHEAQWNSIDLSPHGAKSDADGGMCQACHGNATEHLKDPMKAKPTANPFAKGGTADARTAVCMTCHSGNRNLAFWTSGKHQLNDVTCSNCHSIHGKALAPTINKFVTTFLPNQADICANCHQPIRAATLKPSHHPIPEGKVKCSDCHNPHGAITPAMLKQPTINDQCYSLPRRQARPVRVQPSAGRGELRDLPQPARLRARQAAERIGAEPVPGLPRLVAAPGHDLRCGRRATTASRVTTRCRAA